MDNSLSPVIGQWYRLPDADKGQIFQVIDIDDAEQSVEVQYFDGNIEELPTDAWHTRVFESCAAPEDWTGPYDNIRRDDLGYSDTDASSDDLGTTAGSPNNAGDTSEDVTGDEADE